MQVSLEAASPHGHVLTRGIIGRKAKKKNRENTKNVTRLAVTAEKRLDQQKIEWTLPRPAGPAAGHALELYIQDNIPVG